MLECNEWAVFHCKNEHRAEKSLLVSLSLTMYSKQKQEKTDAAVVVDDVCSHQLFISL